MVMTAGGFAAAAQAGDGAADVSTDDKLALIGKQHAENALAGVDQIVPCTGDPNNLLYPLNIPGWTLVDFCAADSPNTGVSRPAVCPDQHNDDDSSGAIALPFTFDLYGDLYTSVFVNNNGNLSFSVRFSTFSSVAFPTGTFKMVAPFWADVDTGRSDNILGDVYQKFVDSDGDLDNDTLVVTWANVGYYNLHGDLRNTFQVAISDGSNPLMGFGNNICFSYDNMCWTTGDASGGAFGFGGTPATVGANRGDGANYFQVGRFDSNTSDYDGPGGNNDGVNFLDGQRFCFSTAVLTNICPIALGLPAGNSVTISAPGVLNLPLQFISPELQQITSVVVTDVNNAVGNGLIIANAPGNPALLTLNWPTDCGDAGDYVLNFIVSDDYEMSCTVTYSIVIHVVCAACSAGGPYSASCGGAETLIGLAGSAPNFSTAGLSVLWTTTCPGATFSDPTILNPTLTVPGPGCTACEVTLSLYRGATLVTSCSAPVTITDTIRPNLTIPGAVTLAHGNYLCDNEAINWLGSAVATDNCDTAVAVSNNAPACGFPYGTTTVVTWTAEDNCGNRTQASSTITILPADRTSIDQKGSLLIYPKVELRWNAAGALIQDTFLSFTNDESGIAAVQFYFINGDGALAATPSEREHLGWNKSDAVLRLTPNQSIYWSASRGFNSAGGSPFTVLDPGSPPGRPDPDVPGERVLRGYVLAWVVDDLTVHEIRYNHLTGTGLLVRYDVAAAWDYLPWAYQTRCVPQGAEPLDCTLFDANGTCCTAAPIPGRLDTDGFQYSFSPSQLILDFYSTGSTAFARPGYNIVIDTDLTLLPVSVDLRQETTGPVTTKAKFDIWNQNEVRFSNQERCITCWDQTLVSRYGAPQHMLRQNLQTEKGKARIDGLGSTICANSREAALLGVAARVFTIPPDAGPGQVEYSGSNLVGAGLQSAQILYDIPAGPEELSTRPTFSFPVEGAQSAPATPVLRTNSAATSKKALKDRR